MNQNALNLQSTKTRVFFWIGILILPVFWIWWMRERYFSKTQRIIGWSWTAFYVGAGVYFHEYVATGAEGLALDYHFAALRVSVVLAVWFILRTSGVTTTIVYLLVLSDALAILTSLLVPAMNKIGPRPGILILPLLLIVGHLLLDPVRTKLKTSRFMQWLQI